MEWLFSIFAIGEIGTLLYGAFLFVLAGLFYVLNALWFLLKSGRLFPMLGSFMAGLVKMAGENRYLNILSDSKRLPPLHEPRTPKAFDELGASLAHRNTFYKDVFVAMKAPFHGNYALSYRLCAFFRPEFQEHLDILKRYMARFADYSDEYMRIRAMYKQELETEMGKVLASINRYDLVIARLNLRIGRYGLRRYNALSWSEWCACRKQIKRKVRVRKWARQRLKKAENERIDLEKKMFLAYKERIVLLAKRIIQLDTQRLRHGVHELDADFGVINITVHSGRLFDDLIKAKDSEAIAARKMLNIPDDFPLDNVESAKLYMLSYLENRAPLSNTPAREDILEIFLRVWLKEVQTEMVTPHFLQSLPLPGASGLAQAEFGHKTGTRGNWLKPALPKRNPANGQFMKN